MPASTPIPVAILGATGYTGCELVRLLLGHPRFNIACATSQQYADQSWSDIFPAFTGQTALKLSAMNLAKIGRQSKLAFVCLPHGESMAVVKKLRSHGVRVVDLGADYRLKDLKICEKLYGPHQHPQLLQEAVYGLPEIHRQRIKQATLVANPGCYPTSVILGLAPLAAKQMLALDSVIVDAKSGVSGAGRALKTSALFAEVNEDFKAYAVGQHRHAAEMVQELSGWHGQKASVCFVPHLLPLDRGILATIYVKLFRKWPMAALRALYEDFYRHEPFVKLLPEGIQPNIKAVRGTNFCHLQLTWHEATDTLIVTSSLDNLTKGASGQALQNANLMMSLKETLGLMNTALVP